MRKRRISAKARNIARAFLAGESGPSETCLLLAPYTYWNPELFSEQDKLLIKAVNSETDTLPIGRLQENWHPDFLQAKLEQLAKYDAVIRFDVRDVCERLIATSMAGKSKQEENEDS